VRQTDLLGWTLAELALALLFALFAAFAPSYLAEVKRIQQLQAAAKNSVSRDEAEELRLENIALRLQLEASRKDLRSKITPPCSELDKDSGTLFTATVESRDFFEIEGKTMRLDQILRKYANQLADAKARGCVQQAHIYFDPTISATDFDYATKRLGMYFYLGSLGERPE
jgi:hypothetical protein